MTTTTHLAGPQPTPTPRRLVVPLLPALFEAFTAAHHRPRHWLQLPVQVRGDVRVIWTVVRAGQTDPWLAALTGWRHRATWHRRTRPLPTLADLDDAPTTWAADHRAAARDSDREIAGQYLALAAHLITDRVATVIEPTENRSPATPPRTHLLHLGNKRITVASDANLIPGDICADAGLTCADPVLPGSCPSSAAPALSAGRGTGGTRVAGVAR